MFEMFNSYLYPAAVWAIMIIFYAALIVFTYVFMGLVLQTVAKKLHYKRPWLAWIPIVNMWMLPGMAKMHWWPILTFFVGLGLYITGMFISLTAFTFGSVSPSFALFALIAIFMVIYVVSLILFVVFSIVWQWKICERMKRPGWWAVLLIIPLFGAVWMYVMWGMLAWSKA